MGSVSMQSQALSRAERLSAIVDGETQGSLHADVKQFFADLVDDDRASWSDYHLIGDALRSDDLVTSPASSVPFVNRFAALLADEPHLLAPAAAGAHRAPVRNGIMRRRVLPAFAVAAAAATLTWVVVPRLQGLDPAAPGHVQSASTDGAAVLQRVALVPASTAPADYQATNIIRDARLDQYLEAHQQFAQQPMVAGPMPLIRAAASSDGR
jgi:sigma-E factor negative regulatory protein RseA